MKLRVGTHRGEMLVVFFIGTKLHNEARMKSCQGICFARFSLLEGRSKIIYYTQLPVNVQFNRVV